MLGEENISHSVTQMCRPYRSLYRANIENIFQKCVIENGAKKSIKIYICKKLN